jgi:hypothetical protein
MQRDFLPSMSSRLGYNDLSDRRSSSRERRKSLDPASYKATEPLLDQIAEIADQQLAAPELQRLLSELSKVVGEGKVVNITLIVDVFDKNRERALPLLSTGLLASAGKEPSRTWNDSTPHRYVVADGIQVVPHDRCPVCWGEWDFKFKQTCCPSCGATLGKECKVLLDTDECPWCEQGKVSVAHPKCDQCGFEVDLRIAVWG